MNNEILEKLNDYQMQAVFDISPTCLVNASVGSGKTTVLIAKVFYLYMHKNIPLEDMVVLTFTNKAANEIKARMLVSDDSLSDEKMPYFGTFHSVALKMLKTILPINHLGYAPDFSVIDPDEETDMARQLITEHSLEIKYQTKLNARIEKAKQGKEIYGIMKSPDDIHLLMNLLEDEKRRQNQLDFDDLIEKATMLLGVVSYRPKWIIVDEFQDSDEQQLGFIRAMRGQSTQIFAVGDPNQVIYTWRGSKKNVFALFETEMKARVLSLPVNYRSCANVLEAAKCFIGNGNKLEGVRENGNRVIIRKHLDAFNESQYLVERVLEIVSKGNKFCDIAVLYRMQSQSGVLEDTFQRAKIPFCVSLKKTLQDIPVLGWLLKVLRFCLNPQDTNSALLALTNTRYGEHLSIFQARTIIRHSDEKASLLYESMLNFSGMKDLFLTVEDIITFLDIDQWIRPTSADFPRDRQYINIFFSYIREYACEKQLTIYDALKEYLDSAMLYGLNFLNDSQAKTENKVQLMTLHAAKGLEFKYVFIIGANQGIIPMRSEKPEEEEEERRLFFVGITRAKDQLELSYYSNPGFSYASPYPSHYLSMIPPHLTERHDQGDQGTQSLQELRRKVLENRENGSEKTTENSAIKYRKASHDKYGDGVVINESDDTIVVSFEGYGEKEFMKIFGEVEIIEEEDIGEPS